MTIFEGCCSFLKTDIVLLQIRGGFGGISFKLEGCVRYRSTLQGISGLILSFFFDCVKDC